jgi:TonB family protein
LEIADRQFGGGDLMQQLLFTPLPSPQSRWKSFATGWGVQAFVVASLLAVNALLPQAIPQARHYVVTNLAPYVPPVLQEPQPVNPRLVAKPQPVLETPAVAKLVVPSPERKRPELEVKAPDVKIESKLPMLPIAPAPKVVATNTFSTGSSVMPTTTKPAAAVQTGGFGDPNGVTAKENRGGVVNIGQAGSFDLPSGSGRGNGVGGATPGVVASTGFGNGVAIGAARSSGVLQQSGFDAHHSTPELQKLSVVSGPPTVPLEILSKPKPDYTEQGRKLKIDGEVRLEVLFTSNGQIHVIKVLQGLGYGLDEQAVKAAEQIKFKPALHEGRPVDSTAVVHIVFQLAS